MLLRLLRILIGLASFALVATGLRSLVPWPTEYGLRAKGEWIAAHRDRYDTLFVGSSVTAYGVVPRVFDAVMAERGYPTRSFNFGVGGMSTLEADHALRRLLELDLTGLRFVFVESGNWDPRIYAPRNTHTPRMLFWHSVEHTAIALECLRNLPPEVIEREGESWRRETALTHLELALRRYSNVGQGRRTARALLGLDRSEVRPTPEELEALDGFVDLDSVHSEEWARRRAGLLDDLDGYRVRRAAIDRENAGRRSVDEHLNLDALRAQQQAIVDAGARPVYFTGPRLASSSMSYALAEAGLLPIFLGFNQPGRYPQLYEIDRRFDRNHLNRRGSEEFTRLLAEAFADRLDAE